MMSILGLYNILLVVLSLYLVSKNKRVLKFFEFINEINYIFSFHLKVSKKLVYREKLDILIFDTI